MFDNFNVVPRTRNQRRIFSLIIGLVLAITIGLVYGLFMNSFNIRFEFQIVFILIGYGIGIAIQKIGRGVQGQIEFSIIAAGCAFLCFLIADLVTLRGLSIFTTHLSTIHIHIQFIFARMFDLSGGNLLFSVLSIFFRAAGVLYAYRNAVLVINR